jgi:NAD+ kinase
MAIIGLVPHGERPEAMALAEKTAGWLEANGHEVRLLTADGDEDAHWGCPAGQLVPGLDLVVSLGGDGTMLRTVDLVCGSGVPVLGVNVGHLGYLTEVMPDELPEALTRFLAGDYRLEPRMTLEVEVVAASGESEPRSIHALNDAVLQRTPTGHTVRLAVSISGEPFLTYAADSMIVASPTGSTAYNLSAHGPVVSPRARVLVITPVAAHQLFDRSLVLAQGEDVSLEVIDGRQADLIVDGQDLGFLSAGDVLRCRTGQHDALLVSFGNRHFHQILKQKFNLPDR